MDRLPYGSIVALSLAGACGPAAAPAMTSSSAAALDGYDPNGAARWADMHVMTYDSPCAEFVWRSLAKGGGLDIGQTSWVPTLVSNLEQQGVDYTEYPTEPMAITACAGDVAILSDAVGDDFCPPRGRSPNCGHAAIVVVSHKGKFGAIVTDSHNRAHSHIRLSSLMAGRYSTGRIYHLSSCEVADSTNEDMADDSVINGGVAGIDDGSTAPADTASSNGGINSPNANAGASPADDTGSTPDETGADGSAATDDSEYADPLCDTDPTLCG